MKKIISLFALLIVFAGCALAQANLSRFHNTQTTKYVTLSDTAPTATDTYTVTPQNSKTYYFFTELTHAKTIVGDVSKSRKCDEMVMQFTCDTLTAGRVVTFGTNFKTTTIGGTVTVKKSKKVTMSFLFSGTYWYETGRAIEY